MPHEFTDEIELDDNEVALPLPVVDPSETNLPGGAPVSAPDGDTCAPRVVPPPGTFFSTPGVLGRPAMELTPARAAALPPFPELADTTRVGVDNSQVRESYDASTEACDVSPANRSNDIRVHPRLSRSFVQDVAAPIGTEMVAGNAQLGDEPPAAPSYHRASSIAAHLGISTKTVHRRAAKENWPAQGAGNRTEYLPPFAMPDSAASTPAPQPSTNSVTYTALSLSSAARQRVLQREEAVKYFLALAQNGMPKERAYVQTASRFAADAEPFLFSTASLRRWLAAYATLGVNGLVEQKQGVVGRKPAARFLSEEQKSRLQAQAIEHGSRARAGRLLMRDPELHAGVRQHLHGAHPSKSYLPPSIREAAFTTPMTAALHTGPRAAKMMTSSIHAIAPKPGEVYVADDETPNIYVWEPWPNKLGYVIRRPQILQIADCGSLMPIAVRVVLRHSGAYTADDVAGLLGDACDDPGLPKRGFLLEGGAWHSNKIIGHKTNLSVEERIGGITALGLEVFHARTPSAKWQIEGQFHLQQHIMDACPGYCGRNERTDLPEKTKKLLALADTGKVHPSEFLLSLTQFTAHVMDGLREYAHECQDGKTLRGESPFEKWNNEKPALRQLAEKDKWLYRSAMSVVTVKRNGELRISHGSGRNQRLFYYHNAPLLMPRAGSEVAVFWNDSRPESDCVIMAGRATNPKQRICIGVAKYVREISRFDSTKGELGEAMQRKAAELQYAKTELRTLAPHLLRTSVPVTADATARQIGATIAAASARHEDAQKTKVVRARADASAARFGARLASSPSGEGGEGGPDVEDLGAAPARAEVIERL